MDLGVASIKGVRSNVPEWIAHDKESNIGLVGASENIIAATLYEFAISLDHGTTVEFFLKQTIELV